MYRYECKQCGLSKLIISKIDCKNCIRCGAHIDVKKFPKKEDQKNDKLCPETSNEVLQLV